MNIHVAAHPQIARDPELTHFALDVLEGLSQQAKQLSPKYFYDAAGSELFERITTLPEYYPTRTELAILRDHATQIAGLAYENAVLVEFGAGATTKARLLLATQKYTAYAPVDISGDFLAEQAAALRADLPQLPVHPVTADFTKPFALPDAIVLQPKVGFFPGSTIGNFDPHDASDFLRSARRVLGRRASMIVGVDLEKDEDVLRAAYNDAEGVTAQFNLNVLTRINRELDGDIDLSAFEHQAIYNADKHRIEMHLVSRRAQIVHVIGREFTFGDGESIHTESSYKYSLERFAALARRAGWKIAKTWTDANSMFSVHALTSPD